MQFLFVTFQKNKPSFTYEIIVVDDGSKDATSKVSKMEICEINFINFTSHKQNCCKMSWSLINSFCNQLQVRWRPLVTIKPTVHNYLETSESDSEILTGSIVVPNFWFSLVPSISPGWNRARNELPPLGRILCHNCCSDPSPLSLWQRYFQFLAGTCEFLKGLKLTPNRSKLVAWVLTWGPVRVIGIQDFLV